MAAYQDGFDRLLDDLARKIGMDGLKFDADHFCHITVDDEFPVTLRRDTSTQRLVLLGQVASALPELDRTTVADLLALGLQPLRDNGIGVGYEATSQNLILYQTLPLGELNLERLQVALGNFFETIKTWRRRLQDCATANTSGVSSMKGPDVPPGPGAPHSFL